MRILSLSLDWRRELVVFASVTMSVLLSASVAMARESKLVSTSGFLVEEVLAETRDPHRFDWRSPWLQVEGGYATTIEANSFESSGFNLGLAKAVGSGLLARLAWRHIETRATASTSLLAQTPFSQAGQPSHEEFLAGLGYPILEGRSQTPLSPHTTDIGHALFALGGLQYNLFAGDSDLPPGLRAIKYSWIGEAGVRFQIYLPRSLGGSVEWTYSMPLIGMDADLPGWQRVGGTLSWSFGG
jgi:hypothetical protein